MAREKFLWYFGGVEGVPADHYSRLFKIILSIRQNIYSKSAKAKFDHQSKDLDKLIISQTPKSHLVSFSTARSKSFSTSYKFTAFSRAFSIGNPILILVMT